MPLWDGEGACDKSVWLCRQGVSVVAYWCECEYTNAYALQVCVSLNVSVDGYLWQVYVCECVRH